MRKASVTAVIAALSLVSSALPASAIELHRVEGDAQPFLISANALGGVKANDLVGLNGQLLDQVQAVLIDNQAAEFSVVDSGLLNVRVPRSVMPGDVVVTLAGEFGERSFQNLFEVSPTDLASTSRITIGTFQGFAAVYTKNFKGRVLTIEVDDRTRTLPPIADHFSQNLTQVGAGRVVQVRVFLDYELVKVQRLRIK